MKPFDFTTTLDEIFHSIRDFDYTGSFLLSTRIHVRFDGYTVSGTPEGTDKNLFLYPDDTEEDAQDVMNAFIESLYVMGQNLGYITLEQ